MQKTLDILERNVQWFALGLGGIVLLWSVYHYVVTPPASVDISGRKATPGEVAQRTADEQVRPLQQQIASESAPPTPQIDLVQPFQVAMNSTDAKPIEVAAFNSLIGSGLIKQPGEGPGPGGPMFALLPVLPKAVPDQPVSGLSTVNLPNPNADANGNAAAAVAVKTADIVWADGRFKILAADLKKAFSAPFNGRQIDPTTLNYDTTILKVELQRQRSIGMDANGQPTFPEGDTGIEVVPPLRMNQASMQQMPADNAPLATKFEYIKWAQDHPDLIYLPPFYEVVAGDQWTPPQQENTAAADTTGTDTGAATPESTTAPAPAEAPQSQPAQPATEQPKAEAQPAGPRSDISFAPEDGGRPYGRYGRGYGRGGRGYYDPRGTPGRGPVMAAPEGNGAGSINPLDPQTDITIWAHDETVKPGVTYRYRIVYYMKNPIFGSQNLADAKLAEQFSLKSPPSDWSAPVTVPEKTKFWIAGLGKDQARFDIFQWISGNWKVSKGQAIQPGDVVPGTDWTLVDVRGLDSSRERDKYVLLTDDSGEMSKRDWTTDRSDAKHKDLLDQTNPNKNAESTANTPARTPPAPGRSYGGRGRGGSGLGGYGGYRGR